MAGTGTQALSLDAPMYSVKIGDQHTIITLADILKVAQQKNELVTASQRISKLDVELKAANEKLSVYWTKILEGQVIIGDLKRQLTEEKKITKSLMKFLGDEIGWRGRIASKHYLQGKFLKKMGNEFVGIIGLLASWLRNETMAAGVGGGTSGGRGSGRKGMEALRGIVLVLKNLKGRLEEEVISKGEEIISNLGYMKKIIKTIVGDEIDLSTRKSTLAITTGNRRRGDLDRMTGLDVLAMAAAAILASQRDDDVEEFETHIDVGEDDNDALPIAPQVGEELNTSGDDAHVGDRSGFQGGETTPNAGIDAGSAELQNCTTIAISSIFSSTAAATVNENKHAVHPDNRLMCTCGFTSRLTNLNNHIWRLTEGRCTTTGVHVCPKCGDRFTARNSLIKHIAAHRNGGPKQREGDIPEAVASGICRCISCQRFFPNWTALTNHRRKARCFRSVVKHVASKPEIGVNYTIGNVQQQSVTVTCLFCGAQFSDYDELYKHRQSVHGIAKKYT